MRITTRMAHSRAVVKIQESREIGGISYSNDDLTRWILLPGHARRRYNEVLAAQSELENASEQSEFNSYIERGKQGVIACGIAYNYLMENYDQSQNKTILKISQYPLPMKQLKQMWSHCDEILVLEDGQPFVEEQLSGLLDLSGKVKGRLSGEVPRVGELNPDNVRKALGLPAHIMREPAGLVVPRPPALCQGCGHRDLYEALNEVLKEHKNPKVFSDIGCYTLGALPPFRAIDSTVDMGASITMAKGAADSGQFPAVAVIGDSTFTHSGITGLLDAVNSNANVVVIISDNLTTGMTGGQDSAGTGKIEDICYGIGVQKEHLRVVVPLPKNMEEIKSIIREELEYKGVSVIIPRRECIQTMKRKR